LIVHAATQLTTLSPDEAADWAEQIPNQNLRQRVLSAVATEWSCSNPSAAANLALHELPQGRFQDNAVIGIVQRWALSDPGSATGWVQEFTPGTLRDTAFEVLNSLQGGLEVSQ
jgi:hypothetical protein